MCGAFGLILTPQQTNKQCTDAPLNRIENTHSRHQQWQLANRCQGTFPNRTAFLDKHGPHTNWKWHQTPPEIFQPLSGTIQKNRLPLVSWLWSARATSVSSLSFFCPFLKWGVAQQGRKTGRVCEANWKPGHLLRHRLAPPSPSQGKAPFH